jgi:predicted Fe-Mo cluster-binding NifX family protein
MSIKIAAASNGGSKVDEHFGRATKFSVYELEGESLTFLEVRETDRICRNGEHNLTEMERTVNLIRDCPVLLVAKIGYGARAVVQEAGIKVFEANGSIETALKKLRTSTYFVNMLNAKQTK